eukprot:UN2118
MHLVPRARPRPCAMLPERGQHPIQSCAMQPSPRVMYTTAYKRYLVYYRGVTTLFNVLFRQHAPNIQIRHF